MLRYAITNGGSAEEGIAWMERTRRWLDEGVELIQIREKTLSTRALCGLTRHVMALPNPHGAKILVNDRTDIAIACGAHGVHLRDHSIDPLRIRRFSPDGFLIGVSCHERAAVESAEGADFLVVAPIFKPSSKTDLRATLGLQGLSEFTSATKIPVFALGGVSRQNAQACIDAGAAGVAGITLFYSEANTFE